MTDDRAPVRVRPASFDAVGAMTEIYNEGIRGRTATFETRERAPDEVAPWVGSPRHPALGAEGGGGGVGGRGGGGAHGTRCWWPRRTGGWWDGCRRPRTGRGSATPGSPSSP